MKHLEGFLATVGIIACMAVDSPDNLGIIAGLVALAAFAAVAAIEKARG